MALLHDNVNAIEMETLNPSPIALNTVCTECLGQSRPCDVISGRNLKIKWENTASMKHD